MSPTWPRDAGVWLLLAIGLLLPFGAAVELPLLLAALAGTAMALRGRIDGSAPGPRLATVLFACYWLPELVSAVDAVAPRKAWTEVAADLRFLPLLWFALHTLGDDRRMQRMLRGLAWVCALWCADALLQAGTGWSLGGAARGDRLSGIFGDDNLKLGGVIATLAPLALWQAWQQGGRRLAAAGFVLLLIVVLLAGARAAWITLAVGVTLLVWHRLGARRGAATLLLALGLALLAGATAYLASPRFAERIDRTAHAFSGERAGLDHALAGRLPIWQAALSMSAAHPVNGVGVRGFRYAYPDHAAPDDPWVTGDQGALHAHHWVLEVSSETGAVGLACWLLAGFAAVRAAQRASSADRARAGAPGIALLAMLFPLNTHYAVYSNFWSILLFLLLALWLAALHARPAPHEEP